MLKTNLPAVICLPFMLCLGCGAEDDNGMSSGYTLVIDASQSSVSDMSMSARAPDGGGVPPDGGGVPPDDIGARSGDGVDMSDAEPEMMVNGEDEMETARDDCESFSADHFYRQSAERFSDYEMQTMCEYRGRILFIANTAARCGLTPQYTGLQAIHERYESEGLTVLGFLSDDFGQQGGSTEEVEMCNSNYQIGFEQFTPVGVLSSSMQGQHPIFRWLTSQSGMEGDVDWNFGKFLVSEDGRLLARWSSFVDPQNGMITAAIESALNDARVSE